jgi:hypothetical protein
LSCLSRTDCSVPVAPSAPVAPSTLAPIDAPVVLPIRQPLPYAQPLRPVQESQPVGGFFRHAPQPDQEGPIGGFSRGLSTLSKIYDKSLKYRGSEDSFDMRLRVFEDLCPKAGVEPADYNRAFSTMLAGEASVPNGWVSAIFKGNLEPTYHRVSANRPDLNRKELGWFRRGSDQARSH